MVVEAYGEIDATIDKPIQALDGFSVTFDAVDKGALRRAYQSEIETMKLAIALESEAPSKFSALSEGGYLTDEAGKIVYSFSLSGSAEGYVSRGLSAEGFEQISARYSMLKRASDIDSVKRLFSQTADLGTDRLKAFLSGWAALEILIAKSFKTYEQVFFLLLTNAGQPTLRERFLGRIKEVMKDKNRLTDKLVAVAAVLFPAAPNTELQADYEKFCHLKGLRDSISHGDEFSEADLPVNEVATLLRKYVLGYIAYIETSTAPLARNITARDS